MFAEILKNRLICVLGLSLEVPHQIRVTLVSFTAGTPLARSTLFHGAGEAAPAFGVLVVQLEISLSVLRFSHGSSARWVTLI